MLAVTTRNCLRSPRLGLPMLGARLLIARQLSRAPGLVCYAKGECACPLGDGGLL